MSSRRLAISSYIRGKEIGDLCAFIDSWKIDGRPHPRLVNEVVGGQQ